MSVREGDAVAIELQGAGRYVLVPRVATGHSIKAWKKAKFDAGLLVGAAWGALFEVRDGKLHPLDEPPSAAQYAALATKSGTDNRALSQAGGAQGLGQAEVEEMKRAGRGAGEIIGALAANSATWEGKTAFAQEKWLAKKLAKYVVHVRVVRPTGRELAAVFFAKDAHKIGGLRGDALAWMLNWADLRAGSTPLVLDMAAGLLAGAVTERTWGGCQVTALHTGPAPRHIVSFFNFPEVVRSALHFEAVDEFAFEQRAGRFSALLAAAPFEWSSLLQRAWPCLLPGSPFAIFSPFASAFDAVMLWLRREQVAVEVRLTEVFFRQYQVLPERTHPDMQMDNASGFVLTGIKVVPAPLGDKQTAAAARKMQPKKRQKTQKKKKRDSDDGQDDE